jgi:hypothetical protein
VKPALALLATLAGGCVEGLEPAEVGLGRRVGMFPGAIAATLPPMTDRAGNIYVATGMPDDTGTPQPGVALVGGARGGWSEGCATGEGARGGALGWIGATAERGWLWTATAIVELDAATGACRVVLDRDPVSDSDLVVLAAAPLVDETVSGVFAMAIVAAGTDPAAHLITIDLDLGVVRSSAALGTVDVLAVGAGGDDAAFAIRDGAGTRIVLARPHAGITGSIAATMPDVATGGLVGEIAFGTDGSIAAVLGRDAIAIGTAGGLATDSIAFAARTIERDDGGTLWLVGDGAGDMPQVAAIAGGRIVNAGEWATARAIDDALSTGVIVVDERGGMRVATRWTAHGAHGTSALVAPRRAPAYAVGARAVLVADPPVDRGGIPYSQLAVVPVGVEFP